MLESQMMQLGEKLAAKLAYDQSKQEILQYALIILSTTVVSYLLLFFVALIVGLPGLIMTAAISAGILRLYSGGAHASCPERCVAMGVIIFTSLGLIANYLTGENLIISLFILALLFGGYAIYTYAPADAPGKPIASMLERQQMRKRAFLVLLGWGVGTALLYFLNLVSLKLVGAACLGVLWQSLSLTPLGYTLEEGFLDGLLKVIIPIKA